MRRTLQYLGILALLITMGFGMTAALTSAQGNSANAKLFQKGGWQQLQTAEGERFASQDECVSYGASGGVPEPVPTVNPDISAVLTTLVFGGGPAFTIDVSGTGFTPGGEVTFVTDFLNGFRLTGYDFTFADPEGDIGPYRLNTRNEPLLSGIWACAPISNPHQAVITATDVTTGFTDATTVNLPC